MCLVNRKEAENKEEIRAARSPRGFSNLDFKNEGSKSAQSHLINEIETDSIDLSRLDQTFLKALENGDNPAVYKIATSVYDVLADL